MRKLALSAAILCVLAGTAAAEEVTASESVLVCADQRNYRNFTREVQESGNVKQALANAVLSHRCRTFGTGTVFVIEKAQGEVLVRVHVKGERDSYWTSRLLLR